MEVAEKAFTAWALEFDYRDQEAPVSIGVTVPRIQSVKFTKTPEHAICLAALEAARSGK